MGSLEGRLKAEGYEHFGRYCDKALGRSRGSCCRSWSLVNYITFLSGKKSYKDLSQRDVDEFKVVLKVCDGKCGMEECVRYGCSKHNAVIQTLKNDILDKTYEKGGKLKYVMTHLAISKGLASKDFYEKIKDERMVEGVVKVVAMDFDLRFYVFDQYLIKDLFKATPSFVCIVVILLLYTGSPLVTLFTFLNISITLVISTFVYIFVFNINFFPFLNLLVVIILYATGVDAMFVFVHVMSLKKSRPIELPLQEIFSRRLSSALAGFASASAATCVAYLSGGLSDVAVLKCFAIFASLSVVVHFVVSLLFMPSVIVLNQRISLRFLTNLYAFSSCLETFISSIHSSISAFITLIIHRLRIFLVFVFSALTLILVLLFALNLDSFLPSVGEFKLLVDQHPFEMFESISREHFVSETFTNSGFRNLSMRFVWGVVPVNTGRYLAQEVEGDVEYTALDLSSKKTQVFLYRFCRKVRASKYYTRTIGLNRNNCFMDEFRVLMARGCVDIDGVRLEPCCSVSRFPYQKKVFNKCFKSLMPTLAKNVLLYSYRKTAGLRFNSNFTELKAIVVEFVSNIPSDADYGRLKEFHNDMQAFTRKNIHNRAPKSLKAGWFNSELTLFDLQQSLLKGILTSLLITFVAICIVCCISTGLTLLSLISALTITFSTTTSLITLLLSGWTFNVFESMAFSLVVGLSIDFTLHNAVLFKNTDILTCNNNTNKQSDELQLQFDEEKQVELGEVESEVMISQHSKHKKMTKNPFKNKQQNSKTNEQEEGNVSRVETVVAANGAIFLAGLTTFTVGVCYHSASIMAYTKLSALIVTVVCFSWTFSTFFFLPLASFLK